MKNLIVGTGGYVIQADSFASSLFVQSFKRIWEKDEKEQIDMNFNATVEIKTSREVKVCGMIGAGTSLKANSSSVSENEMGVGRVPNKVYSIQCRAKFTWYYIRKEVPPTRELPSRTSLFGTRGLGGTCQWRLPALNSQTSLAFLLEVVNQVKFSILIGCEPLTNQSRISQNITFSIMLQCHKVERVWFNLSRVTLTLVAKQEFVSLHWQDRGRILKLV